MEFAIKKHGSQKYAGLPYKIHLVNVINVLLRNKIFPDTSEHKILWKAAWLHDVLEDTNTSKEELINIFGLDICEIVWALTDGLGKNRMEKKEHMYNKLIQNQNAIIVKLADRIANVEFSIINNDKDKIDMYCAENIKLNSHLEENLSTNLGRGLLNYLNNLIFKINH